MSQILSLPELRGLTRGKLGITDAPCPLCGPYARSPFNQKREVLRVWDNGSFVTFKCARCDAKGWLRDENSKQSISTQQSSPRKKDRAELAARLWSMSDEHGLHEVYLRSRQCLISSPNLRSLPANGKYPPAMIARFGNGTPTGVHLTHLRPDGQGKADMEVAKITLGPSIGQPIIVHQAERHKSLFIAEGIEDAASLAIATKRTVWAAGSAGRIAPLMPITNDYDRVFIAVDPDKAGAQAFDAAKAFREDIIPLSFGGDDANEILRKSGSIVLAEVIKRDVA